MNRKERRARAHRRAKQAAQALRASHSAANRGAQAAPTLQSEADALAQQGRFAEAVELYQRAVSQSPVDVSLLNNLAGSLARSDRADAAIECYRKALAIEPDSIQVRNNLGVMLEKAGEAEEAVEHLERAVALDPDLGEVHFSLAESYSKLGRSRDAANSYQRSFLIDKKAHARNPGRPDFPVNMGRALMRMKMIVGALDWFRRALAIDRDHVQANYFLGRALAELRKYDEAADHLRRAAALAPDQTNVLRALGPVLMKVDRLGEAARVYNALARLDPDDAGVQHFAAILRRGSSPENSPREYVVGLFDDYAESFDAHLVDRLGYRSPQLLHDAVLRALGDPPIVGTVVDLGCGTGLCGPLFRALASRLVGVDLSPQMLEKARERGDYDELICDDVVAALLPYDANVAGVLAADVFVYIGKLDAVFGAARRALRPDGWFAFTTEITHEQDYVIDVTGRFSHAAIYIARLAESHGFAVASTDQAIARYQGGEPVETNVVVLRPNH